MVGQKYCYSFQYYIQPLLSLIDCWRFDSHERPNFQTIIDRLDEIAHSNLPNIPDEFHEMQNDWRLEIGDRMEEIRVKEYVSLIIL